MKTSENMNKPIFFLIDSRDFMSDSVYSSRLITFFFLRESNLKYIRFFQ